MEGGRVYPALHIDAKGVLDALCSVLDTLFSVKKCLADSLSVLSEVGSCDRILQTAAGPADDALAARGARGHALPAAADAEEVVALDLLREVLECKFSRCAYSENRDRT